MNKPYDKCPKCGEANWEEKIIQRDDTSMTEKICCLECGHIWCNHWSMLLTAVTEQPEEPHD